MEFLYTVFLIEKKQETRLHCKSCSPVLTWNHHRIMGVWFIFHRVFVSTCLNPDNFSYWEYMKKTYLNEFHHGSYNLEKVLNLISHLEFFLIQFRSLKVLDFFIKSWIVLEFHYLVYSRHPFPEKLDYLAEENLAHPRCKNL